MKDITPLNLLREISAWLSFNQSPSREELSKMRADIDELLKSNDHDCIVYVVVYTDRTGEDAIENMFIDKEHATQYLSHIAEMNDAIKIIEHPIQIPTESFFIDKRDHYKALYEYAKSRYEAAERLLKKYNSPLFGEDYKLYKQWQELKQAEPK